jgi:hypothetical protein
LIFFVETGGLMEAIISNLYNGLTSPEERAANEVLIFDYLLTHLKQHSMHSTSAHLSD